MLCCSPSRWWFCWCWRPWRFGFSGFLLNRVRLHLPSSLRHGLANLYRPGNQSAAVLAALGTGVMLILSVYLMQKDLLTDLRETASPKLPNVFLVDVRSDEVDGVKAFFAHQAGVSEQLGMIPVVIGRFVSINGQPVEQMKGQHYPIRMLESAELTWADAPPEGDKVTAGAWWTSGSTAEIAVSDGIAQRLQLAWVLLWNWKQAEQRAPSKSLLSIAPMGSTWPRGCHLFSLPD